MSTRVSGLNLLIGLTKIDREVRDRVTLDSLVILLLIRLNPGITVPRISEATGIGLSTVADRVLVLRGAATKDRVARFPVPLIEEDTSQDYRGKAIHLRTTSKFDKIFSHIIRFDDDRDHIDYTMRGLYRDNSPL